MKLKYYSVKTRYFHDREMSSQQQKIFKDNIFLKTSCVYLRLDEGIRQLVGGEDRLPPFTLAMNMQKLNTAKIIYANLFAFLC